MSLSGIRFPTTDGLHRASWRPVFFRPNLDTPERLVAGVIAFADGEWHLRRASALDRLKCLYGDESNLALEALTFGLDQIDQSLKSVAERDEIDSFVSGIEIGEAQEAQAYSSEELALRCVRAISSLHNRSREFTYTAVMAAAPAPIDYVARDILRDRLSVLVMERVAEAAPHARAMFNAHVHRLERDEGARLLTHKAYVAFTGQKVAANFATLKPGRQKVAVDVSKRLMWDLEQHRESESDLLPRVSHEMILYHPAKDDPTITSKQYDNVMDVVETLQTEGERKEIKVLPHISVPDISRHILEAEGLRAA